MRKLKVGATMMTRRKFLRPPSYGSLRNPITGVPRARKLKLFFQYGPPQSFFQLAGSPYKKHAGAQISKPPPLMAYGSPLLALAPQSEHGSAACAETGPPQSFFERSSLALQKARVREVAQR